ncbi:hypothetical protein K445DRAFT_119418 [Daldinia sp. EC12]|nr:hypothetical protein K445DRAFT_119418 [Daldinia sp. EC12]
MYRQKIRETPSQVSSKIRTVFVSMFINQFLYHPVTFPIPLYVQKKKKCAVSQNFIPKTGRFT